jgi:opacity protein-like surface antigen
MNRSVARVVLFVALLGAARPARADWLLTPFAGATFNTDTIFLDLDDVASRPHAAYGVALTLFPERVFGVSVDASATPSLFTGHDLVESSRLLTAMGSLVIALPKRFSRAVRPYAGIGAGLVHVRSTDIANIFPIDSTKAAASVGLGAWLPVTARLGARGEVRFLRSGSGSSSSRFETWQATVGAAIRF